jgi:hydroxysqualene dehydroxylase
MSHRERFDVAILGGGVAGICAALRCAEAGASVALLEVRPRLGGAAYSVQRDGLTIDNGQHVFLRRCDAYRGLLRRLGSEHLVEVQKRLEIPVLRAGAKPTVLRRDNLPAPAHLARAMLSFAVLPKRKRLSAAATARALGGVDPKDPANDRLTFGQWLSRRGQSEESIAALWDLVVLPTLNLRAKEASLALGAFVFQEGLLNSTDAGDIGFHRGSLSAIIGDPALEALQAAGVEVRLRWRAQRVLPAAGARRSDAPRFAIEGRSSGHEARVDCETAIVALPHQRAAEVLPAELDSLVDRLRSIGVSPIVNLHVLYDRKVCDLRFAAGVYSPLQYLFDRSEAGGAPSGEQYLAVSLSGADEEMAMSVEQLKARYLPAIAALLPAAKTAVVKRFLVTREHAATFRAVPGIEALRPPVRSGIEGLALAGAYTDTGWPATLEGAALSGNAAAEAVLGDLRASEQGAPATALDGAR